MRKNIKKFCINFSLINNMSNILEAFQSLDNKLSSKFSTTFKINSRLSDIKVNFPTPLDLDNKLNYELGLSWFTTYNSIYNVNEDINNPKDTNTFQMPANKRLRFQQAVLLDFVLD